MSEFVETLGYKEAFMPYYGKGGSLYPGHHGVDLIPRSGRADGYPIKVSGIQIGQMGATGTVTGAHLHVDKGATGSRAYSDWRNPSDWQSITGRVSFAGWAGSAGNMVTIAADNGHLYRFLHLRRIDVRTGQRINKPTTGGSMASDTTIHRVFLMGLERKADAGALKTYRPLSDKVVIDSVYDSGERKRLLARKKLAQDQGASAIKTVKSLQTQIAALKKRPTVSQLNAIQQELKSAQAELEAKEQEVDEIDSAPVETPSVQKLEVEIGNSTRGWLSSLINIFRR